MLRHLHGGNHCGVHAPHSERAIFSFHYGDPAWHYNDKGVGHVCKNGGGFGVADVMDAEVAIRFSGDLLDLLAEWEHGNMEDALADGELLDGLIDLVCSDPLFNGSRDVEIFKLKCICPCTE